MMAPGGHESPPHDLGAAAEAAVAPRDLREGGAGVDPGFQDPEDRRADIVEVNVGGRIFVASRGTLCFEPDSMLATLVGGPFGRRVDGDGRLFIDADGEVFPHILGYLRRSGRLVGPPQELPALAKLKADAEYFGLQRLVYQVLLCRPTAQAVKARMVAGAVVSVLDLNTLEYPPEALRFLGFSALELKKAGCCASSLYGLCTCPDINESIEVGDSVIIEGKFGTVAEVSQRLEEMIDPDDMLDVGAVDVLDAATQNHVSTYVRVTLDEGERRADGSWPQMPASADGDGFVSATSIRLLRFRPARPAMLMMPPTPATQIPS